MSERTKTLLLGADQGVSIRNRIMNEREQHHLSRYAPELVLAKIMLIFK
jgi:hypothetical protein